MGNKLLWIGVLTASLALVLLVGLVQAASADTGAVIDEGDAKGRCIAAYPGAPSGPDPLSPCQWDMSVINAGAAQAKA